MTREIVRVDVTNSPDLARLAEEVRATLQPRCLEKNGEALAMVTPVAIKKGAGKQRGRRAPTAADREAFLSSFGAWRGLVDGEQLKRNIAVSRAIPPRPRPEL
jgi:hypothetical protein